MSRVTGKESSKTYVAIKGTVFDVTGNESYTTGPYKGRVDLGCGYLRLIRKSVVFAGKDASRALAMSSVKPEDVTSEWEDLGDKEKKVLDEWTVFFSKRYNVVGKVVG